MSYQFALIGDIGGTNARLALCELASGKVSQARTYACAEYPSLESVIKHYIDDSEVAIQQACIAIACPVQGDWVSMTNHSWEFSIEALQHNLGLETFQVINDFTAVSMAIPVLAASDVVKVGHGAAVKGKPIAVYGAGTGLGVAHLLPVGEQWLSLPGEGGHVDLAPGSPEEDRILAELRKDFGRVSAERCLSGQGIVNLYHAVVRADGRTPEAFTPKDVVEHAQADTQADCRKALNLFCVLMGRFAGNLALNLETLGGVYIAGGVVPRFVDFLLNSEFRTAFEDKGRFNTYLENIPVFLITHKEPGLLGAGAYLRQSLGLSLSAA
ncbi:glucokinase [Vibrio gazogenes]|uniref:Glucokinase n=1 Tax=Vibrio gazogenes DSM 21264 = NBRC 103151 TaxID=1123492 RepID=A0A1M5ELC6_VIBGA|nr:glucokinase [Vibrio gazogenes]USP12557.1 glucokinase [Vibrio gazogenes]SHF80015.1 glucokinase [Vibrio gazogenes DSM 21264] [Vibrio gazogenes DSM 21264 = NBRC 103151]SJN54047.1 Glucokinase [Vibrio gazogenes]